MNIRFQADNDLRKAIVDATLRREPGIDFQTAQQARLDHLSDDEVLRLAASEARILVTHDKRSMSANLQAFTAAGGVSPGILVVIPQNVRIAEVVETLILIWTDDHPEDWTNVVVKIPF